MQERGSGRAGGARLARRKLNGGSELRGDDGQQLPSADTAWRYQAAADLQSLRVCASAELLLTTKMALDALDASTGTPLWTLADLPDLEAGLYWGTCGAATGLSYKKVSDISEYQAFLADTDSSLILYVSADGPLRLDARTGATLWRGEALAGPRLPTLRDYAVTNAPDSTGRTGNSLVRVSLEDGSEAGRIWFREKGPRYLPDTARDQVLVVDGKRTLVALRFPAGAAGTALRE